MIICTIGFTKKSAEDFFELLQKNNVNVLIDIRLNNNSQLAGFSKGRDLKYFLSRLCNCEYYHDLDFAPTKEILDSYKNNTSSWEEYEKDFIPLLNARNAKAKFDEKYRTHRCVCLLCSEPTSEHCHRRLVAEHVSNPNDIVIHL